MTNVIYKPAVAPFFIPVFTWTGNHDGALQEVYSAKENSTTGMQLLRMFYTPGSDKALVVYAGTYGNYAKLYYALYDLDTAAKTIVEVSAPTAGYFGNGRLVDAIQTADDKIIVVWQANSGAYNYKNYYATTLDVSGNTVTVSPSRIVWYNPNTGVTPVNSIAYLPTQNKLWLPQGQIPLDVNGDIDAGFTGLSGAAGYLLGYAATDETESTLAGTVLSSNSSSSPTYVRVRASDGVNLGVQSNTSWAGMPPSGNVSSANLYRQQYGYYTPAHVIGGSGDKSIMLAYTSGSTAQVKVMFNSGYRTIQSITTLPGWKSDGVGVVTASHSKQNLVQLSDGVFFYYYYCGYQITGHVFKTVVNGSQLTIEIDGNGKNFGFEPNVQTGNHNTACVRVQDRLLLGGHTRKVVKSGDSFYTVETSLHFIDAGN